MSYEKSDGKRLKIQAVADPLAGLPVTMDIEKDSLAEQKAMTEAFAAQNVKVAKAGYFKGKEKKENNRRDLATNPNYWCCLVFQSKAQKDAFLENAGLTELGPRYLDGRLVAAKFGVPIPEQTVKFQGEKEDAAMTLGFEPIEPFPATLEAKKQTWKSGKSSPRKRQKPVPSKHIQFQQFSPDSQSWYWAGEMQLLPDGKVTWAKTPLGDMVSKMSVRVDNNPILLLEIKDGPELFFEALIKFGGDYGFKAVPMDDPARASELLHTPEDVANPPLHEYLRRLVESNRATEGYNATLMRTEFIERGTDELLAWIPHDSEPLEPMFPATTTGTGPAEISPEVALQNEDNEARCDA